MSNKKKGQLPASSAGLLRFFEDETEGVKIRPEFVLGGCFALIITSITLNLLFRSSTSTASLTLALHLLFR